MQLERLSACLHLCSSVPLAYLTHLLKLLGSQPPVWVWLWSRACRVFQAPVQGCQAMLLIGSWTTNHWPSLLEANVPVLGVFTALFAVFISYRQGICSGFEVFPHQAYPSAWNSAFKMGRETLCEQNRVSEAPGEMAVLQGSSCPGVSMSRILGFYNSKPCLCPATGISILSHTGSFPPAIALA